MQIRLSLHDKIKREGEEALSKYIVKRVFLAVATLLIVCGITFFSMNAIPGGPFDGEKAGIQNYLWDDLFVGWTCGMLISFDVCCGTDLWDCTMLKGNRF